MAVGHAVIRREAGRDDRHRPDPSLLRPGALGDPPEADEGDLGRIDHAEHRLDPLVAEVRHRDRRVGHLRAAQGPCACAPHEVRQPMHQIVDRSAGDVVQRGRDEAATTQRDRHADVHGRTRGELAVAVHPVQLGDLGERQRHRLELQHGRQDPLRDRHAGVARLQPFERRRHRDRLGQVVVRDLALGPAHRRRDRAAHLALAGLEGGCGGCRGRGRCRGRGGRRRRQCGALDIRDRHRTAVAGADDALRIDPEHACALARRR